MIIVIDLECYPCLKSKHKHNLGEEKNRQDIGTIPGLVKICQDKHRRGAELLPPDCLIALLPIYLLTFHVQTYQPSNAQGAHYAMGTTHLR